MEHFRSYHTIHMTIFLCFDYLIIWPFWMISRSWKPGSTRSVASRKASSHMNGGHGPRNIYALCSHRCSATGPSRDDFFCGICVMVHSRWSTYQIAVVVVRSSREPRPLCKTINKTGMEKRTTRTRRGIGRMDKQGCTRRCHVEAGRVQQGRAPRSHRSMQ